VAGLSADAVGTVLFLVLLMAMPAIGFLRRAMPSKFIGADTRTLKKLRSEPESKETGPFNLAQVANGIALSLVICAVSVFSATLLKIDSLFIIVMVVVHLCLLVIVGRWMKLDLAEVMIASNACILGPAPAAALAASKGWQPLDGPGILVGLFGYAIATFIGVALTGLLKL
jgi:uncharacterized membrane protein